MQQAGQRLRTHAREPLPAWRALDGERLEAVIERARDADPDAFRALYRAFHPLLLAFLRARRPADAEDIASETWLRVSTGLKTFQGDAAGFRAWLFHIARCRLVDDHRRAERRPFVARGDDGFLLINVADARPGPESRALSTLSIESILAAVAALSPDQADVLLLRAVAGLTVEEVAVALSKRNGAIRAIQHRAVARLAKALADAT